MLYRFFSSSFVSSQPQGKEVLAFRAAFVPWLAEWPSGKLEWAGGRAIGSIKCHGVSSAGVYFLFICRMSDMDTSVSSRSSQCFVLSLCFPPSARSTNFMIRSHRVCFCLSGSLRHRKKRLRLHCHFSTDVKFPNKMQPSYFHSTVNSLC